MLRQEEEFSRSRSGQNRQGSASGQRLPHRVARAPVPEGEGVRASAIVGAEEVPELGYSNSSEGRRIRVSDLCD